MLVNNMSVTTLHEPAEAVDPATFLVDVEALLRLQQLRDGPACVLVILEFEIAHQVMWVEVEFLDAEGSWNLTLIIDLGGVEELTLGVILQDIACLTVN